MGYQNTMDRDDADEYLRRAIKFYLAHMATTVRPLVAIRQLSFEFGLVINTEALTPEEKYAPALYFTNELEQIGHIQKDDEGYYTLTDHGLQTLTVAPSEDDGNFADESKAHEINQFPVPR